MIRVSARHAPEFRLTPATRLVAVTAGGAGPGRVAGIDEHDRDPEVMAAALIQLRQQAPPSSVVVPGLLDGMDNVNRLARKWLDQERGSGFRARIRRNG